MKQTLPIMHGERDATERTNAPRPLRGRPFAKGPDARRGVSLGRPTDEFTASMRALASADAVLAALAAILKDKDHPHFLKAFAYCANRGYGRPSQPVDVTTNGESLADVLRKGRERVRLMRNPENAQ